MNLPTMLTILRILSVPLVVLLIVNRQFALAFWVFLVSGATDGIDGFLARRWNQRTELGAYLDATADKALLVSIYVALALEHSVPHWLAIAVVSRDVMIVGAVILSWLLKRPVEIAPHKVSKANTLFQILFAGLVLASEGHGFSLGVWREIAVWIVAALTVLSAGFYLAAWMRHMAGEPIAGRQ